MGRKVVDVDLEKFFDRVNHGILMERLARRVSDKPLLRLVRRYLQAGILAHGVGMQRLRQPIHELTRRNGGRSLEQLAKDLRD